MAQRSLMHHSAFMKRRKVVAFLFATMLAVILVGGWGQNGPGLSTIAPNANERIVMWADLPSEGTPEDYDLLTNLKFAAQKLYTSSYFHGESIGEVRAKVGPIPYTQQLRNMRTVSGNTVFAQTISTSSLVDSLEQQYSEDETIFMRKHDSIDKNGNVKWSDTATYMSMDTYAQKYGTLPREISKYIIGYTTNENPDVGELGAEVMTILSVRDENAVAKAPLNTDGSTADETDGDETFDINGSGNAELGFDVPQTLVADENGYYKFTLVLDPINSTKYYRNEVQTRADANDKPSFISAEVTVTIDKDWTPISVTTAECYSLYMMGFNAVCTGTITEVFSDINSADAEIPAEIREFYAPYIANANANGGGTTGDTLDKQPSTPIEYLSAAFADYFDGSKPLDLVADVSVDGYNIYDLYVSIDFATLDVKAKLGKLGLEYLDDKVYITLNDIKGYVSKDKFLDLMNDPNIAGLMTGTGIDIEEILGDEDFLTSIFADCEMTVENGVTRIRLPFTIEGIYADASLYIKDDGMVLQSITGEVDAFGKHISITVKPKTTTFAKVDDSYVDLSSALDFIPDAIATATATRYGISGTVSTLDNTFDIDAYIDRTDGLIAEATVTALGQDVVIKYIDEIIYIEIGNVKISGTADDMPALADAVSELTGIELGSLDDMLAALKKLLPRNVDEYIDMIKSVEVGSNSLSVELEFLSSPINITLSRANGGLSGIKFDVAIDLLGVKFDASADLAISAPAAKTVTAVGEYVPVSELTPLLVALKPYVDGEAYDLDINKLTVTTGGKTYSATGKAYAERIATADGETLELSAALDALGQAVNVTFADNVLYISLGNINVKLDTADIETLMPTLNKLADALGIDLENGSTAMPLDKLVPELVGMVESMSVNDGTLIVTLNANGAYILLTVNPDSGAITANVTADGIAVALTATVAVADKQGVTAPNGEFIDVAELQPTLEALIPIINEKALSATVTVNADGTTLTARIVATFDDGLALQITEKIYGLTVTVLNNIAYISIGDVKVMGSLDDVPALLDALGGVVPEDIATTVTEMLGSLNGDIDVADMLDGALSAINAIALNDGVLGATVTFGDTTLNIETDVALNFVTVRTTANNNDITVRIDGIEAGGAVTAIDTDEYVPAEYFAALIGSVMPLAFEDGYTFDVDLNMFGVDGTGKIYVNPVTTLDSGEKASAQMRAEFMLGTDLPVAVTIDNGTLYIELGNGIKVSSEMTEAELMEILGKLEDVMPGITETVLKIIDMFLNVKVTDIIGMLGTYTTDDGFALTIDTADLGIAIVCTLELKFVDGKPASADIACDMAGTAFAATAQFIADGNGTLRGITVSDAKVYTLATDTQAEKVITALSLDVALTNTGRREINVGNDYVSLARLTDYIAPIKALAEDAQDVKSITLNLDAFALTANNEQVKIGGSVTVALAPELAVDAVITVFEDSLDSDGNDASEKIYITYVGGTVYIRTGDIMLSFDTEHDVQTLYEVLSKYLPDYLNDELAKLLNLKEGSSMFSELDLILGCLKKISQAQSTEEMTDILFGELGGTSRKSAIKAMLDMVALGCKSSNNADEIFVTLDMFGLSLNLTPYLTAVTGENGSVSYVLDTVSIDTTVSGIYVSATVTKFDLLDTERVIKRPADADTAYVSIAEFVTAIDSAVSTFTTRRTFIDENGEEQHEITFAVDTFDFDYDIFETENALDENGEPILDDDGDPVKATDVAGRLVPVKNENGEKQIANHVEISNTVGQKAIMGKFIPRTAEDANGNVRTDYMFNLEVHLTIAMDSFAYTSPLTLDLYVINDGVTDVDNDGAPDAVAYLNYQEKSGYGEKISIDYTSIMEIVAAVMDILHVDEELVDMLIADEYRQPINTKVFESMSIPGIDDIRTMLSELAIAVGKAQSGFDHLTTAWDLVTSVDELDTNDKVAALRDRLEDSVETVVIDGETVEIVTLGIKSHLQLAAEELNAAIAAFGGSDDATENVPDADDDDDGQQEARYIDGSLFKMIVNGVKLLSGDITTTDEDGNVVTADGRRYLRAEIDNEIATQTEGVAHVTATKTDNDTIHKIDSIEVGELDVNTARLNTFLAVFSAGDEIIITLPDDYNVSTANTSYSNFANIKHLLFDVMNTANMLEFEIGNGVNDNINVVMDLSGITDNGFLSTILKVLPTITINISYNAKIQIIDQGECANPRYKTAAAIELNIPYTKQAGIDLLPDCTTRVFFYDDVIYLQGVKSGWSIDSTIVANKKTILGISTGDKESVFNAEYVDAAFTVDEFMWMVSNDISRFFKEFVFTLVPLKETLNFGVTKLNIHDEVINAMLKPGDLSPSIKTVAQIFKGYTYDNGAHELVIGLQELSLNKDLSDMTVSLTGANDGDANILDNYIAKAHIDTNFVNNKMVHMELDATLINTSTPTAYYTDADYTIPSYDNTPTDYGRAELVSTGLSTTCIADDRPLYTYKGEQYFRDDNKFVYGECYTLSEAQRPQLTLQDIIDTILAEVQRDAKGNITDVLNRSSGVTWQRVWQADYLASLAA